jgi:predicted nucleic acid-binding protein
MFLDKIIVVYYADEIITEYKNVLSRERFGVPHEKIGFVINVIRRLGIISKPEKSSIQMVDESDRIFFDTAKDANAWLITGNIKHFPSKEFVCTVADFYKKFS